ncbi:MAG TPA: GNAT family N-acetyltransferase [Stellaceae bacterium]|jgi:GNAT superfamily N-acetyltransferase|nr:GNAT family N-acetyltransferase [Stellaceae bacterium]
MIAYRPATLEEAPDILAVMKALADEIPLRLDRLEDEEALYRVIRTCARSGESWVATDGSAPNGDAIVGVALVQQNETDRFWGENEALEIRHAGVLPSHRRQGILTEFLARILTRLVPVTVQVAATNDSGIGRRLEAARFIREPSPGGQRYRWEPGARSP